MKNKTCWIDVVGYQEADANLKQVYDGVRNTDGSLDNLYQAFSLRPHTVKPADDLYRAALHDTANSLPRWFSELIGTYVAILTGCEYAESHHGHNFAHLLDDPKRSGGILKNLRDGILDGCGSEREVAVLRYVQKLCLQPQNINHSDVELLTQSGWSDGEILEIVQIVAMFSYFVRVINGVGISLHGDRIGFY